MTAWNTDRVTRLKTLWASGRSAAWISIELGGGLSRNAVLAKVWRLGLSRKPREPRPGRQSRAPAPRMAAPTPQHSLQAHGAASILSVRRLECRWPCGDPKAADFSLCGAGVSRGAYCKAHAAVAYRSSRPPLQGLMTGARLT